MTNQQLKNLQRRLDNANRKLKRALPYDPSGRNDKRARQAAAVISAYRKMTGAKRKNALAELLADLMHLCDRDHRQRSFESSLDRARDRYAEQTAEPFRD